MQDSIRLFLSAPLSGKAYESAKNYFMVAYTPIGQSIIMTGEALASAHQKFLSEYQATVSGSDMDEDKLIAEIDQYKNLVQEISDLITEAKTARPDLEKRATNAFDTMQKRQEKLDHFRDYSNQSASYFSEYISSQQELDTGLAQVKECKAWNSSTGTFDINRIDMTWATPIRERWKRYEERHMSDSEKLEKNLKEQFGFNTDESRLLMSVYDKLKQKYGTEKANKLFWQLMASPVYTGDLKNSVMWTYTAGLNDDWRTILGQLGMRKDDLNKLENILINQHSLCAGEDKTAKDFYNRISQDSSIQWDSLNENEKKRIESIFNQFSNKVDFAHMAAIIASYMNDAPMEDSLGEALGLFGGVGGLNNNSGYIGDIVGVPGTKPSLGNDDYRADLDSVNIFNRITKSMNSIEAMNQYFRELSNGNTNRADEFVTNIGNGSYSEGISILQQQYTDFTNSGSYKNMNEEDRKVFAEFFLNVINSKNQMK